MLLQAADAPITQGKTGNLVILRGCDVVPDCGGILFLDGIRANKWLLDVFPPNSPESLVSADWPSLSEQLLKENLPSWNLDVGKRRAQDAYGDKAENMGGDSSNYWRQLHVLLYCNHNHYVQKEWFCGLRQLLVSLSLLYSSNTWM